MRKTNQMILACAVAAFATATASAQVFVGSTGHVGDAAQMTRFDQQNNAAYNHMVTTGVKTAVVKDQPDRKISVQVAAPGPASAGDIKPGSALRDKDGVKIGIVDSVATDGVVVNTGQTKIKVPLMAFGKDNEGLLLGITAARFNELVTKTHASN